MDRMTERASEKHEAESKACGCACSALAKETAEHHSQSGRANESHGEQSKHVPTKAHLEVPNKCSKDGTTPSTLEQLSKAPKDELACIYKHSSAGKMPNGSTDGKAMFMPGTLLGKGLDHIADGVWAGKVFNMEKGGLINRILGLELVKAEVKRGPSWMDGKESIIVDYKNTSLVAGFLRDEIREVKPGLYLGVAYARAPFNNHFPALYFALDANKKK